MSFEITSPDNKNVLVKLRTPTREMLSDVIEVYGSVDEQGNIVCMNYTTFEPSAYSNFGIIKNKKLFLFIFFVFRYGFVQ